MQTTLARLGAMPPWQRAALTLALGALAALLCGAAGTPLPWMVGPLLAAALGCIAGAPLYAPTPLRNAGQLLIGAALGLYFTPQVVGLVVSHWGAVVAGIAWALALGASFGVFLRRANPGHAGLDRATLFFASAIGGASEMAVLAERHGGRMDVVASAHSLRLLLVVLIVPFGFQWAGLQGIDATLPGPQAVHAPGLALLLALCTAGAWAMRALGMSNAWMLGPLAAAFALTANGIELSALPKWMSSAAQLAIGVSLGTRFTPAFLRSAPRWLATVAIGTLAMIALSAAYAWVVARATGLHPATVLLGTSPGGIAEMCITAKVLQLGVPVVTAFHVTRMAAVVMLAGPLFRWRSAAAR
jgi:membrane AbrB-like protein